MWWLWIAGPIAVAFIYVVTARTDKARAREAEKWRASAYAKRVKAAPSELSGMFIEAGGGSPLGVYEILPKLAYCGIFNADVMAGSDHQTIVCKLAEPAPTFVVRPLPIVDGARAANTGVPFTKHTEFGEEFLVEADKPDAKTIAAIRKWLPRPLRKALLEQLDVWMRVSGRAVAFTLYGPADADRLDELVVTADAIFAEWGADGGPSLLVDDEEEDAVEAPKSKPKAAQKPAKGSAKKKKPAKG